jgi:hypothetical protein
VALSFASFSIAYLTFFRATAASPVMRRFWGPAFPILRWPDLGMQLRDAIGGPMSATMLHRDFFERFPFLPRNAVAALLIVLAVIGCLHLSRTRGWSAAALVAGPLLAVFGAFVLHRYPMSARLMTFGAPLIILLVASGIDAVVNKTWSGRSSVFVAAGLLLLVPGSYHVFLQTCDPLRKVEHPRPVVEGLLRSRRPNEPVYIAARGVMSWLYYSTDWSAPDTARLRWVGRVGEPIIGPVFGNNPPRGHPVLHEDETLTYDATSGREIYGIFSGMELRPVAQENEYPDEGWARNEAQRIRIAAEPCAWLFLNDPFQQERVQLLAALATLGGVVEQRIETRASLGARMCFSTTR